MTVKELLNLSLDYENRDESFELRSTFIEELKGLFTSALIQEGFLGSPSLSLSFVDGEKIKTLNRDYRNIDEETDVLSFPLFTRDEIEKIRDGKKAFSDMDCLGDIVINMDRVYRQAEEFGHSREREINYLSLHSLLHLLGYDHESDEEKKVMRSREEDILANFDRDKAGEKSGKVEKTEKEENVEEAEKAEFHSGYVCLLGRPNVGKSSLLNRLLGQKLSIVSKKAQTTRHKIQLIDTRDSMQVIYIDTPGIQIPKNELGEAMLSLSRSALDGVDLCIFLSDIAEDGGDKKSGPGPLDRKILDRLRKIKKIPIIMALNKIDLSEGDRVAENLAIYQSSGIFKEVIPISAKTDQGIEKLTDAIYKYLPPGPMYFPEDMVTDRSERFLICEIIREKCLKQMQDEIPHGIYVSIEDMKKRDNKELFDIYATIHCEKNSHKGMIIGKGGSRLKEIGSAARTDIEDLIGAKANLKIWVKVDKNWRKNKSKVKKLAFE